jgi:hypothetical protein
MESFRRKSKVQRFVILKNDGIHRQLPGYPLFRRLGGHKGEEKHLLPLPEIGTLFFDIQPIP